jgi:DNA helicase-2/ATP-dependent DNA helicase PcrA
VIDLANKLRTDRLQQEPSSDEKAPNMTDGIIRNGCIKFLYSFEKDIAIVKQSNYFSGWDFHNAKQTKELSLTHNLIAPKAEFPELMEIYDRDPIIKLKNDIVAQIKKNMEEGMKIEIADDATFDDVVNRFQLTKGRGQEKKLRKELLLEDPITMPLYEQLKDLPFAVVRKIYITKDALIDDKKQDKEDENKKGSKRDRLIKHLFKIQTNIHLYNEKQYNEFLRKTEFKVYSIAQKKEIKEIIETIKGMSDCTIENVIDFADEKGICKKDDAFYKFVENNHYLFNRVKSVKFQEFQKLFYYLEGFTPFSTQHKTKGTEFDNVLVILDNGGWNTSYNFKYLFGSGNINQNVLEKTQKIFYVCCTRAKENLIVY